MQGVECATNQFRILVFKNCIHHAPHFHPVLVGFLYGRCVKPDLGANKLVVVVALPELILISLSAKLVDPTLPSLAIG